MQRIIGEYGNYNNGKLFIIFASIHGNEKAGYHALKKLFHFLESKKVPFEGKVIGLLGNMSAFEIDQRFIHKDLNRQWYATKIIKKELGEKQFNEIINLSEPIAAASIAQVHLAKIKIENKDREVAIKILRPGIEKLFNEELDALMLLAYIIENSLSKAKRLKLVEVVHLLREITNIEMDLRFEAAAANELYENTKNDIGFNVPKIYWNYTSKGILTLDKVNGVSIREQEILQKSGINLKKLAENLIQHFLKQAVRDGFFHGDMHPGNIPQLRNTEPSPSPIQTTRRTYDSN